MGNASSRSPELISNDVMSSLSPTGQKKLKQMAHPNFYELATLTVDGDTTRIDSESSTKSDMSQGTQTTHETPNSSLSKLNKEQSEYEELEGRPYITSDPGFFFLPCDSDESDRMVILHFLIKFAFNGNFVSPIVQSLRMTQESNRPKVLDIGCGAGTWILEMGTEYPTADFHGIDIRTMFPSTIKPPNTYFSKHNFIKNLPFPDNTFVFIRMQLMLVFVNQSELQHLLSEIYRTLKPGGYFELLDCEYQINRPGPLSDSMINHKLRNGFSQNGIDMVTRQHISTLLMTRPTKNGFIDVHHHGVATPLGWGPLGDIHLQNFSAFLKSIHPRIRYSLYPQDKSLVDAIIDKATTECTSFQSHVNWFVCYCQKPQDPVLDGTAEAMMYSTTDSLSSSIGSEGYLESISDFSDGYID